MNDLLDLVFLNQKPSSSPDSRHPSAMKDASSATESPAQCPVDHKTRDAWLAQARAASGSAQDVTPPGHPPHRPAVETASPTSSSSSTWSWGLPSLWGASSTTAKSSAPAHPAVSPSPSTMNKSLGTQREISTIPRSSTPGESSCPVNHEAETGADPKSGNWVYPSEKMFFDAMRRKGHDAQAADMRTVVPIHNAVNERAWAEIKEWERPYSDANGSCPGGPRLHSFNGLSTQMSPKARINTLLGYTAPFDRHDWVVDRCGTKVEYIIDFYAGSSKNASQGKLNFYLDVRPKLNSWEGVKMRASRAFGLV